MSNKLCGQQQQLTTIPIQCDRRQTTANITFAENKSRTSLEIALAGCMNDVCLFNRLDEFTGNRWPVQWQTRSVAVCSRMGEWSMRNQLEWPSSWIVNCLVLGLCKLTLNHILVIDPHDQYASHHLGYHRNSTTRTLGRYNSLKTTTRMIMILYKDGSGKIKVK